MFRHKLLNPACILSIVGSVLVSFDFISLAVTLALGKAIGHFTAAFVLSIIGTIIAIAGIVTSSLAIERKVYTKIGKIFSIVTLILDVLDFIFAIVLMVLLFKEPFELIITEFMMVAFAFGIALIFFTIALPLSKLDASVVSSESHQNSGSSIEEIYDLYQKRLITKEEFEKKRLEIIDKL